MKRKSFILMIAAMLLTPMSMMAQTVVTDPDTGLKYLTDATDTSDTNQWYVYVYGTNALGIQIDGKPANEYFFPHSNFRIYIRNQFGAGGDGKISYTALQGKTTFSSNYTYGDGSSPSVTFQGIEYLPNITAFTVNSGSAPSVECDFSRNPNLATLTFSNANIKITKLDISNTKLTSISIPTGSKATLKEFKASGTNIATLDLCGCSALETLTLDENSTVEKLDLCYSKLQKLDLYDDDNNKVLAPNLKTAVLWHTAIEELDLSYHTSLVAARYPCYANYNNSNMTRGVDPHLWTGLSLVPTPKSADTWAPGNNFVNKVTDIAAYNASQKLRIIKLKGCTSLGITDNSVMEGNGLFLTHGYASSPVQSSESTDTWMYTSIIEEVDASDCTNLQRFNAMNTYLSKLDLSGCEKLTAISMDQGLLTGLPIPNGNGELDINMSGCNMLTGFTAKRHRWENLDFLLKPTSEGGNRSAEEIMKLQNIQVNGGSYTLRMPDGVTKYIREDKDGNPMKYTCRLREIDLRNLNPGAGRTNPHNGLQGTSPGLRILLVDCNLLTKLDLSVIGPCLQQLECTNNMLTTLDLTNLNPAINLSNCNWQYQVGYLNAEVVKGHWDEEKGDWMDYTKEEEESGSYDWVALHMVNGGYTHRMDNDFGLYTNLYDARYNNNQGRDTLAKESKPWMCKVSEVKKIVDEQLDGYEKFIGSYPCPSGHEGQHIFLHSQAEITADFGKFKDQDLTGTVMTYKYNTGFRQTRVANTVSPDDTDNYSLKGLKDLPVGVQDTAHITVRMHLFPHMLNINPISKNEFSRTKLEDYEQENVNYFSSTIMLDYDALIPRGVTCYTISGTNPKSVFEVRGKALDGQLNIEEFGGENDPQGNWILPANTPVYVRADSPQPAGLYPFLPIHNIELQGWENLRGEYDQDDYLLHGIENLNSGGVKEEYRDALDLALERKANTTNILRGYVAPKYQDENDGKPEEEQIDINHENYNRFVKGKETHEVTPLKVLTLGIQNQTSAWPVIGFWPYRGNSIASNRCYIPYEEIYTEGTPPGGAKGFNFFFVNEEKDVVDVTGVKEISDKWLNAAEGWYNMQGVRLNSEPTQQGVYIRNGKKVTIK